MTKEERSELLKYLLIFTIMFFIVGGISLYKNPNPEVNKQYGNCNIKQIDGCEYLEYEAGVFDGRVYSLTHKGNCKNLYHKNK